MTEPFHPFANLIGMEAGVTNDTGDVVATASGSFALFEERPT